MTVLVGTRAGAGAESRAARRLHKSFIAEFVHLVFFWVCTTLETFRTRTAQLLSHYFTKLRARRCVRGALQLARVAWSCRLLVCMHSVPWFITVGEADDSIFC